MSMESVCIWHLGFAHPPSYQQLRLVGVFSIRPIHMGTRNHAGLTCWQLSWDGLWVLA